MNLLTELRKERIEREREREREREKWSKPYYSSMTIQYLVPNTLYL